MAELVTWGRQYHRILVFGLPESDHPLVVTPHAHDLVVRRCMDLAHDAEQEALTISSRVSGSHEVLLRQAVTEVDWCPSAARAHHTPLAADGA
ncbi:hypothetical protein ACWIID_44625 [Streptomyces phaeochromogenes]